MGARWVDPALGRWLSADTLVPEPGEPQAFNRFSYVLGNPLRYIDPSGHMPNDGACSVGMGRGTEATMILALAVASGYSFQYGWGSQAAENRATTANAIENLLYSDSSSQTASSSASLSSTAGKMGSLDPNDPRFKDMVREIFKEHNRGNSRLSDRTLNKMLENIRSRTGATDVRYTGESGGGADLLDLNTDITTFQRGASTYEKFSENLYSALKGKVGQANHVYMQMNTGLEYGGLQTTLDEIIAAWANEGTTMLDSIYLYDAQGNLLAYWAAGGL